MRRSVGKWCWYTPISKKYGKMRKGSGYYPLCHVIFRGCGCATWRNVGVSKAVSAPRGSLCCLHGWCCATWQKLSYRIWDPLLLKSELWLRNKHLSFSSQSVAISFFHPKYQGLSIYNLSTTSIIIQQLLQKANQCCHFVFSNLKYRSSSICNLSTTSIIIHPLLLKSNNIL